MARESVKHPPSPEPSRAFPLLASALEAGPALQIDAWSLDQAALEVVLSEVDADRETIVECGSGVSTILIGRLLRDRGSGRLYSLEHDPDWVALGRFRIASEGLAEHVRIVEAPLEADPVATPRCCWYARSALAELPGSGVELLLVDGPPAPAGDSERSRYPALPVLAPRLAPDARLILDDIGRAGETWVLARWREAFTLSGVRRSGALALATVSSKAMNL